VPPQVIHLAPLPPEWFTGLTMPKPPSPRPLSIKVIAAYFLIGTAFHLYWMNYHLDYFLTMASSGELPFSILPGLPPVVTGWFAFTALVTVHLIRFYIGAGLWSLSRTAYRIAIPYVFYEIVRNGAWLSYMASIYPGQSEQTAWMFWPQLFINEMWRGLLPHSVAIYYLIKRKSAFGKPTTVIQH